MLLRKGAEKYYIHSVYIGHKKYHQEVVLIFPYVSTM